MCRKDERRLNLMNELTPRKTMPTNIVITFTNRWMRPFSAPDATKLQAGYAAPEQQGDIRR
jgi:hypothetical protein